METKEVKTSDNFVVGNECIESLAMILADCNTERMEKLDVKEMFTDYAVRFCQTLTKEELDDFIAHHVILGLIRSL